MDQGNTILITVSYFGFLSGVIQTKLFNPKWNVRFILQVFSSFVELCFLLAQVTFKMKNAVYSWKVKKFHLDNVKTEHFYEVFLGTIPLKIAETRSFKLLKIFPCPYFFLTETPFQENYIS